MLLLQALSCLVLGISLACAQNLCNSPQETFLDPITQKPATCAGETAAGDNACEAKYAGYFCSKGEAGTAVCCAIQAGCNPDFVAKFDRATGAFKPDCTGLTGKYEVQNGVCCTPIQKPPVECDTAIEVDVNGECKPKADIGGACDDVKQCPASSGAECTANKCECPAAKPVIDQNVCRTKVAIGGTCVSTPQCEEAGAVCTASKCTCPPNFWNNAGTCEDCGAGKVVVNNACEDMKNLGDPCPKGALQCPQGPPAALCQTFCVCPSGYQANGKTQCIKCDKTTQVLVNGVCYPKATFGATCVIQEQCSFTSGVCTGAPMTCQCIAGTVWDGKVCKACAAGKVIANNKCYDVSNYAAACQVNEQCTTYNNGICMGGQCTCTADTAWTGSDCAACSDTQVIAGKQCLEKAPVGGACTVDAQCDYTDGACVNNACGCKGKLQYSGTGCSECDGIVKDNLCYPFAARGQPCTFDEQCTKTAGTKCTNFACECPEGTTFDTVSCVSTTNPPPATCQATEVKVNDQCYPRLEPEGFFCYYPEQCTGGSTCQGYYCKCPATLPSIVNKMCVAGSGTGGDGTGGGSNPTCTGNTALVNGKCLEKTTDGVCLNVDCLFMGAAGCKASYSPYARCAYNKGQNGYFCCQ